MNQRNYYFGRNGDASGFDDCYQDNGCRGHSSGQHSSRLRRDAAFFQQIRQTDQSSPFDEVALGREDNLHKSHQNTHENFKHASQKNRVEIKPLPQTRFKYDGSVNLKHGKDEKSCENKDAKQPTLKKEFEESNCESYGSPDFKSKRLPIPNEKENENQKQKSEPKKVQVLENERISLDTPSKTKISRSLTVVQPKNNSNPAENQIKTLKNLETKDISPEIDDYSRNEGSKHENILSKPISTTPNGDSRCAFPPVKLNVSETWRRSVNQRQDLNDIVSKIFGSDKNFKSPHDLSSKVANSDHKKSVFDGLLNRDESKMASECILNSPGRSSVVESFKAFARKQKKCNESKTDSFPRNKTNLGDSSSHEDQKRVSERLLASNGNIFAADICGDFLSSSPKETDNSLDACLQLNQECAISGFEYSKQHVGTEKIHNHSQKSYESCSDSETSSSVSAQDILITSQLEIQANLEILDCTKQNIGLELNNYGQDNKHSCSFQEIIEAYSEENISLHIEDRRVISEQLMEVKEDTSCSEEKTQGVPSKVGKSSKEFLDFDVSLREESSSNHLPRNDPSHSECMTVLSGHNDSDQDLIDPSDFRPLDPKKYKTELCRAFQIKGSCKYGAR